MQGISNGPSVAGGGGYWAVVGGTGVFAYANGVVDRRVRSVNRQITIRELHIRVLCPITSPEQVRYIVFICPLVLLFSSRSV